MQLLDRVNEILKVGATITAETIEAVTNLAGDVEQEGHDEAYAQGFNEGEEEGYNNGFEDGERAARFDSCEDEAA